MQACQVWRCVIGMVVGVLLVGSLSVAAWAVDEDNGGGLVEYHDGMLSVDAREVRTEDLMKELGDRCSIKIVVHGEVFSEVPVSVQFKQLPLRKGIKRLLRAAQVTNYMMHFTDSDTGTVLAGLDLIGEKGGETHLTSGGRASASKPAVRPLIPGGNAGQFPAVDEQVQEEFLKAMDEILSAQLAGGEEPDPAEVMRIFKEVVPPEIKDQIPPEILQEIEKFDQQMP